MHSIRLQPYDGDKPFDPVTVAPMVKGGPEQVAALATDFCETGTVEFVRGHSECRARLGNHERYFACDDLRAWLQRWRASLLLDDAFSPVTGVTFGNTGDTPSLHHSSSGNDDASHINHGAKAPIKEPTL